MRESSSKNPSLASKDTDSQSAKTAGLCEIREASRLDLWKFIDLDEDNTEFPKPAYLEQLFQRFGKQDQGRYFLIAEDGEEFLGFVIGEIRAWEFGSSPCGWIFALCVHPDMRTRGIGTCLFEAICARFREEGVRKVRTMLARSDYLKMSFFRSQGLRGGPFIQFEKGLE